MDSPKPSQSSKVRLQKYLAECGVASRRACEELIASGAVTVDGESVTAMGVRVDPSQQVVAVRGEPVQRESLIYLVLNKPRDVVCTASDPQGRKTYQDLLPELPSRVYNVGRLDRDSEGLLLVTNDGDLAARLTHPRYHVEKFYHVWTDRPLSRDDQERMRKGLMCEGERLRACRIRRLKEKSGALCYEVVLAEGKNRQVRRMFEAVGLNVKRLLRTQVGELMLSGLRRGEWRYLAEEEIRLLHDSTNSEA